VLSRLRKGVWLRRWGDPSRLRVDRRRQVAAWRSHAPEAFDAGGRVRQQNNSLPESSVMPSHAVFTSQTALRPAMSGGACVTDELSSSASCNTTALRVAEPFEMPLSDECATRGLLCR
jgi:hypothetical protein